jgi:hypothetical protein
MGMHMMQLADTPASDAARLRAGFDEAQSAAWNICNGLELLRATMEGLGNTGRPQDIRREVAIERLLDRLETEAAKVMLVMDALPTLPRRDDA